MQAEMAPVGEAALCAAADRQRALDWTDTAAIVGSAGLEPQLAQLALRSPTSLVAIGESHHAARRMADIGQVLAADLRLARLLSRWPDFAEGVRAVLVDKDHKPRWQPRTIEEVDRAAIKAAIGPL